MPDRIWAVVMRSPDSELDTSLGSRCWSPATRIMKNSSALELKMARNLRRSRSGRRGSRASSRTRALNSSQLSSRFRKSSDSAMETDMKTPGLDSRQRYLHQLNIIRLKDPGELRRGG